MSSKIFTALLRTKGVFLRDEGGEEEVPVCRYEDVGKLCELGEPFVLVSKQRIEGWRKTPETRQLICSALFNSVQEDKSKQNQQLPLWWSSDLHRLFTCLSTTSFSSSHVIQKGGQIRADKLIDNKLLANVELKQLNCACFYVLLLFFSFLLLFDASRT